MNEADWQRRKYRIDKRLPSFNSWWERQHGDFEPAQAATTLSGCQDYQTADPLLSKAPQQMSQRR
jgi:hypothetical protein